MSNDQFKMKKCIIPECKQYFDIYQHGKGTQKYCHIHKEIIRQEKRKIYDRKYYERKVNKSLNHT